MPAQKRSAPSPSDDDPLAAGDSPSSPAPAEAEEEEQPFPANSAPDPTEQDDSDGGEGGSPSSPSAAAKDDYILVKLAEIRKEVQCPICLGIIRKTRTVMECLHRFCRECIDKSMRLGNNECPACRTHCASRRSLRDDPNYDALISALYPDIDMYEEEELAFHEEEKTRNRKIQASIAETFRRQSEALGRRRSSAKATAAAFVRKSQGNFRGSYPRGRGRGGGGGRDTALAGSDDEDEDANGSNHAGKDSSSSSAEEPSPESRPKRPRRWPGPRASPARTAGSTEVVCEENDDLETSKENFAAVPLQSGTREMLAWGRGGARSQTRHGSASSLSGRFFKGGRVTKLLEHLRNLDENENEFSVHLTLLPLDEKSMPCLDRPYLCCRPTVSIRHLCQFIAIQSCAQAEEVNIFVREAQGGGLPIAPSESEDKALIGLSDELRLLGGEETLGELRASFSSNEGDLVFLYHLENTKQEICD